MKIYFFLLHKINCWFPKSTKPLSEAETTTFKFNDLTYHCIAISHHLTSYQHQDSRYLDTLLLRLCRLGLTWRGMVTVAVCGPAETEGSVAPSGLRTPGRSLPTLALLSTSLRHCIEDIQDMEYLN